MKILFVGDIHIDNEWVRDTDQVLEQIVLHAEQCEKVILLGDIYHRRDIQKGSDEEYRFHKFLNKISWLSEVHILTGNHDLSDTRNLLSEVRNLPFSDNIRLYDEICAPFKIGDRLAVMLPWEPHRRTDSVAWFKSKCEWMRALEHKFMVFGHVAFAEAKFNNDRMVSNQIANYPSIRLLEEIPNFEFAVLGDIHMPQDVGTRALYVGSIRNTNFAESGEKRIILFDTDTMIGTSIPLVCRDTCVVNIDAVNIGDISQRFNIDNKMVKLKITCTQEEYERGISIPATMAYALKVEYDISGKKGFKNLGITDDNNMFGLYLDSLKGKYGAQIIEQAKNIGIEIINE